MNYQSRPTKTWPLREAKAKFSELVRRAQSEGPQVVTVHGEATVVVTRVPDPPDDLVALSGLDFWNGLRGHGPFFELELEERLSNDGSREFSFDD